MTKKYRVLIYCDLEMPTSVFDNVEATIIYDIQECFNKLSIFAYDIIIMQLYKEIENICEIISCIRMVTFIPILFLANQSVYRKKELIRAGADSVINIESSAEEIELHIFSLVRRYLEWNSEKEKNRNIQTGNLFINNEEHQIYLYEQQLCLTQREYDFLYLLASAPRRIYTFEQIYQLVWKDYPVGDIKNIIWCLVKRLRKKLNIVENDAGNCIVSVRDVGYKFELNSENEKQ